MNLGPYELFEIIDTGEVELFRVTKIVYDIEAMLNHTSDSKYNNLDDNTLETCRVKNDEQVNTLNQSIEEVRDYLGTNPDSTKRKNQLEYLSNTL